MNPLDPFQGRAALSFFLPKIQPARDYAADRQAVAEQEAFY